MNTKGTVLVVDDEVDFREDVVETLRAGGYTVLEAGSGRPALAQARANSVDVALLDLAMPAMDGIELMARLLADDALLQVVILTGQSSIESAVEAMRKGALDYVAKPVRLDELEVIVERACRKARLERQNRAFRTADERKRGGSAAGIVAESDVMKRLLREAEALATMDMTVLIQGETGTGKEVVAEVIHKASGRSDMPLTVLNCAALPENLVDAELFGHEKGVYTGATESRPGMIEIADAGTLFLDEIGDMPLDAQTRLLRFLENGTFRRLGARVEKTVDVRVLAATNRNLTKAVQENRFREDLYHRLRVYELTVPPLRDRPADILPLARGVLRARLGRRHEPPSLSPEAQEALIAYPWPGNVRELLNTVERAIVGATIDQTEEIGVQHLKLPSSDTRATDLASLLKVTQKQHVARVLELTGGNRRDAAALLGVSERQLYRLISEQDDS